jgi:hypothetical protein
MLKKVAGALILLLVGAGVASPADLALPTIGGTKDTRLHQAPKNVAEKRRVIKPKTLTGESPRATKPKGTAGERRPGAKAPKSGHSAELSR